jgi:Lon protease-like protein
LERVAIEEEFQDRPYRQARVALRPTALAPALSDGVKQELLRLVQAYAAARQEPVSLHKLTAAGVEDEILINGLATYLDWTPLEKQLLLEADGLEQRARRLTDLLRFALQADHRPSGWN